MKLNICSPDVHWLGLYPTISLNQSHLALYINDKWFICRFDHSGVSDPTRARVTNKQYALLNDKQYVLLNDKQYVLLNDKQYALLGSNMFCLLFVGCCMVLLLILMYIIVFAACLPFASLILACYCVACLFGNDDD